jgi:hypothetical protein
VWRTVWVRQEDGRTGPARTSSKKRAQVGRVAAPDLKTFFQRLQSGGCGLPKLETSQVGQEAWESAEHPQEQQGQQQEA